MGDISMLAYLFRDQSGSGTFAYTTDVTGRNIPRPTERTKWSFVAAADIRDDAVVMRPLRVDSFFVFQKIRSNTDQGRSQ